MDEHEPVLLNPGPNGVAWLDARHAPQLVAEMDADCLDAEGRLQPMPMNYYLRRKQSDIALWCHLRAFYFLPTIEAVEFLQTVLPVDKTRALEIGSGNGCLARAAGIRATDNWQQDRDDVREAYALRGQPTVTYGADVEKLSALEAVEKYKPEVVVAAWVTHRFDPKRVKLGGNPHGVEEGKLLDKPSVRRYVFFGHETIHEQKRILGRPHETLTAPFLVSRAMQRGRNLVWIWDRM